MTCQICVNLTDSINTNRPNSIPTWSRCLLSMFNLPISSFFQWTQMVSYHIFPCLTFPRNAQLCNLSYEQIAEPSSGAWNPNPSPVGRGGGRFKPLEFSKIGPTERTPKPEYLIARSQLTERGPLGFGPIQFLMGAPPILISKFYEISPSKIGILMESPLPFFFRNSRNVSPLQIFSDFFLVIFFHIALNFQKLFQDWNSSTVPIPIIDYL